MPNQEVMREWVSRLRSGEYKQGMGKLSFTDPGRNTRRHCCLGVLADIAVEQGRTPAPVAIPEQIATHIGIRIHEGVAVGFSDVFHYDGGNATMPPSTVLAWADIPAGSPSEAVGLKELTANRLAYLNDGGKTFAEIADAIEEEWIDLPEGTEVPDTPADIEIPEEETVDA